MLNYCNLCCQFFTNFDYLRGNPLLEVKLPITESIELQNEFNSWKNVQMIFTHETAFVAQAFNQRLNTIMQVWSILCPQAILFAAQNQFLHSICHLRAIHVHVCFYLLPTVCVILENVHRWYISSYCAKLSLDVLEGDCGEGRKK